MIVDRTTQYSDGFTVPGECLLLNFSYAIGVVLPSRNVRVLIGTERRKRPVDR